MYTYAVGAASPAPSLAGRVCEPSSTTAGATGVPGLLLLDFSRLKTLLILFTYFPRLMRRSPPLPSAGPKSPGVDMMLLQTTLLRRPTIINTSDAGARAIEQELGVQRRGAVAVR